MTDKWRLLRRHFLFSQLPDSAINQIGELAVSRRLARDERLFSKGDEGDALYGVLHGAIRISTGGTNDREIILNILEPGEMFGEIALLDGLPRTADAIAMGESAVMVIRRRDFMPLLEREPAIAIHLIELLCERVRWVSGLVEDAAFLPLPARLAKRLLSLATIYGNHTPAGEVIGLTVSQSDLARFIGGSRESVNKLLQDWRKREWIEFQRRRIVVRDRPALSRLATSDSMDAATADAR